jgi:zinc protease
MRSPEMIPPASVWKRAAVPLAAAMIVVLLAAPAAPAAPAQPITPPKVEYEKVVLKNGLNVILHEDHSTPIVAVNLWYHVGSKNEKPGRTGFAHLFEHMLFQGSEHSDTPFINAVDPLGATVRNGETYFDRTNYFENVPTHAVERTLWLEADRMGWLLPAMTQERLDTQIEVVQNERRQGVDNQPYGLVDERMFAALYPSHHRYSWDVIGSMEDLAAATMEDVKEFFRTYYAPNNCTLSIAGDIDVEEMKALVDKYFGEIPPGRPIDRMDEWIPELGKEIRLEMEDRVPLPRIYVAWHSPAFFRADDAELELLADILAVGKTSRLYKRLVYDLEIAQDVQALQEGREIAGLFRMQVTARPGHTLDEIEPILFEEVEKLRQAPPTDEEMERARTRTLGNFIRALEQIGGFGGRSDRLARYNTYLGDPGYLDEDFARYRRATPESLRKAARRWLHDGRVVMHVVPFPQYAAGEKPEGFDRAQMPAVGSPKALNLPRLSRAKLSNGLQVVLARTPKVPVLQLNLLVRGGWSADSRETLGHASFVGQMQDEGTATRSALDISEETGKLGANLFTFCGLDNCTVGLSALKARLEPSLALWADVVMNPSFPEEEIERQRQQVLGQIMQEKRQPVGMAVRIIPGLIYGDDHPYGQPFTGSGTEETVKAITREDLVKYHETWFKPNNATLVVVGDTTLDEVKPFLEKTLAEWKRGKVPKIDIPTREHPSRGGVYIIDKPGAAQSVLLAGQLGAPKSDPDEVAFEVLHTVLGGQFTSRVNMNLREDKGYTYGAYTVRLETRGQGLFGAFSQVRTDVTKESLAELAKELREIRGPRPVTEEELRRAQDNLTLSLPGQYESIAGIANKITDVVTYDLPEDYYSTYSDRVRGATADRLTALAKEKILPDRMIWVVVGDRTVVEEGIRDLKLGTIRYLDEDGRPIGGRASR